MYWLRAARRSRGRFELVQPGRRLLERIPAQIEFFESGQRAQRRGRRSADWRAGRGSRAGSGWPSASRQAGSRLLRRSSTRRLPRSPIVSGSACRAVVAQVQLAQVGQAGRSPLAGSASWLSYSAQLAQAAHVADRRRQRPSRLWVTFRYLSCAQPAESAGKLLEPIVAQVQEVAEADQVGQTRGQGFEPVVAEVEHAQAAQVADVLGNRG